MTSPCGVLNSGGKKERRRKINIPKIAATFVYASSQGQRTHSAWTNVLNLTQLIFCTANLIFAIY